MSTGPSFSHKPDLHHSLWPWEYSICNNIHPCLKVPFITASFSGSYELYHLHLSKTSATVRHYWGPLNNSARPRVSWATDLKKKKNHLTLWMTETNCNAFLFSLLHSPSFPCLSSSPYLSFSLFFLHQLPFPVLSLGSPPTPLGHLQNGVRAPAQRNTRKARGDILLPDPWPTSLTAFSVPLRPPG